MSLTPRVGLLLMVPPLLWAGNATVGRLLAGSVPPLLLNAMRWWVALLLRPLEAAVVAPPVIWLSLLNATACTFAPVLMVMMAVERIGAALAAQTGMIGPLSTIAMGVAILGEPLDAWIGAGTLLVLAGVWLLARAR